MHTTIYTIAQREIACHVDESNGKLNHDDLYRRVSVKLQAKGENARTIKSIVQQEVGDLLFDEVDAKK